jgi:hypothetical protein
MLELITAKRKARASEYQLKAIQNEMRIKAYQAYEAASTAPSDRNAYGSLRGYSGQQGESKALPQHDRASMIREISDLMRNDGGLIQTVLDRLSDYVVGDGITPQARTIDERWNDEAEAYFRAWSKRCDAEQRQNCPFIGDGQKLILADAHVRGESFIRTMPGQMIQFVESEMCRNPGKTDGVKWDDGLLIGSDGRLLAYNFEYQKNAQELKSVQVSQSGVIHQHPPFKRARQRRGVPIFAPVVPRMQQVLRTTEAMQLKVALEAEQTLVFTGKGPGGQILNDMPFGATRKDTKGRDFTAIKTEKGMWYDLPEDRSLGSVETRTPSGEHMPYMEKQIEAVSAATGIPYNILMLLAGGSYSATRGQIQAFDHTIRRWWRYIVEPSQSLWNWVIADAIQNGELPPAPTRNFRGIEISDFTHVEWSEPARLTMSPLEDEKVFDAQMSRGSTTITAVMKRKNQERADVWNEKEEEIKDAIERAKRIKEETGEDVHYTAFLNNARPGAGNPHAGVERSKEEIKAEDESDD